MTPQQTLSDRAVSYLRTAVPIIWGTLVTYLIGRLAPHLPGELGPLLVDALGGEATVTLVVALAIAGWYAVWRSLESRIPDWLTRIVLGSAAAPSYTPEADVVAVGTDDGTTVPGPASPLPNGASVSAGLTDHERIVLARAHDLLPRDDPGRLVIQAVLNPNHLLP